MNESKENQMEDDDTITDTTSSEYITLKSKVDSLLNNLEEIITTLECNFEKLYHACDHLCLLKADVNTKFTNDDKVERLEKVNSIEKRIEALIQ